MKDLTSAPLQSVPIPECRSGPSPQTNMCMPTANAQTWTDLQILTTCLVESVLVFAVGMLKDLRDKRSALGRHTGLLCRLGRCTPSQAREHSQGAGQDRLWQRDRENWTPPTPTLPSTNQCSRRHFPNMAPPPVATPVPQSPPFPAAAPAETPAPQSSTELPNVETPPSAAEKEKDQQAEELEEECTVATIAAVADCEAVWKKCVTVVKTADC